MSDNKPITREEMYLAKLTGDYTGGGAKADNQERKISV